MNNSSTEISFSSNPELATRVTYHQAVLLLTKENMDAYKPILVGNIPPLNFSGGTINQIITGNIQVYWYPYRSVALVTYVGVQVEEDLSYIVINTRRAVTNLF